MQIPIYIDGKRVGAGNVLTFSGKAYAITGSLNIDVSEFELDAKSELHMTLQLRRKEDDDGDS